MKSLNASLKKRYLLKLYGIVQGVGFRPFVYRTAVEHQICGFVRNSGGFVTIDITGTAFNIKCFLLKLVKEPPISASIERVQCRTLKYKDYKDFKIARSCKKHSAYSFISPDIGVCSRCLQDMENKESRYYRYAFTGGTDCGPSLTLMDSNHEIKKCSDIIEETIKLISQGKIIVIKGIGGFHLVCDGKNEKAVQELRLRTRYLKEGSF